MATLLSEEQIGTFLVDHGDWQRKGNVITRTFQFADFNGAMGFVTRVGLAAERAFHHPDIDIRWNKVTISLSTHSEGGLTELDTNLAGFCDGIA